MKSKTSCFTGHRKLPRQKMKQILINLDKEVNNLIRAGVTDFISGGALGFDQVAASVIIAKKMAGEGIRLIFALPCKNQDAKWSAKQKEIYHSLLAEADEIIYVSEEYFEGCMKKRNYYMLDRSAYCICAHLYNTGGTFQTVKYARNSNVVVVNIIDV